MPGIMSIASHRIVTGWLWRTGISLWTNLIRVADGQLWDGE